MTHNRCAYAPCAATLRPDGPSPWWCDDTCQRGWTTAQNRAKSLPVGIRAVPVGDPPAAVLLPVRGGDGTQPLPDLSAAAYPPDAVPLELAPVPRRSGWLTRILSRRP